MVFLMSLTAEPTPTNIMTHRIISAAQIRPGTHHDQPGWWINKHQPQSDTNEGDCQNTEYKNQDAGNKQEDKSDQTDYEQQRQPDWTGQCSQQADQTAGRFRILFSFGLCTVGNDAFCNIARGAKLHDDFFHAFIGGILQIFHVVAHSGFALFFGKVRDSCAQFPDILLSGHRFIPPSIISSIFPRKCFHCS